MLKFEHLELEEEFRQYQPEAQAPKFLEADTLKEPLKALRLPPAGLVCANEAETVAEVATRMSENNVGCTILLKNGRVTGICTERDIIWKVLCPGSDPKAVRIEEIMTPEPECLQLDDTVAFALHTMDAGGYRHIPLINGNHEPVGIVSIRDIIEHIVDHFPEEVYNLPPKPLRRGWGGSREGA